MRSRALAGGWVLSVLGALLPGCGREEPGSVKVAVAAPLAELGLMADARQAWQLVVDQINDAGGINQQMLEVYERDTPLSDATDLQPVADGFVDLTSEGYKYIISLVSGAALEPMMNAAMPRGVLTMSITSEESAVDFPSYDGMLLRGILPTDRLIQKQALAMQRDGLTSVAIVGETILGALEPRHAAMHDAYAECLTCTVTSVTYPADADLYRYDWASVGSEVASGAPDVVFLASANPSALLDTIHWIERAGYTGLYYFAYGAYMATLLPAMPASKVPERFRSYDLALPPSDRLEHFLSEYESRYGGSFLPEPRLVAFADYLALLALAMTRVGNDDPHLVATVMKELAGPPGETYGAMDYAAAAAAVRAGRDIDFVGLSGPLDFDERGEVSDGFAQQYRLSASGDVIPLP